MRGRARILNEPFKENNKVPHYVIVLGVPIVKQPRGAADPVPSKSAAVRLRPEKEKPRRSGVVC